MLTYFDKAAEGKNANEGSGPEAQSSSDPAIDPAGESSRTSSPGSGLDFSSNKTKVVTHTSSDTGTDRSVPDRNAPAGCSNARSQSSAGKLLSSKNSVIIRWLADTSSHELLPYQAQLTMKKRALEKERIEKLGYMVPLVSSLNNDSLNSAGPAGQRSQGSQGSQGTQGSQGSQGSQGTQGSQGSAVRSGRSLPALSHNTASPTPFGSISEESAIPIRTKRAEIQLAIDPEIFTKKLTLADDEEMKSERKSILRSPFKRVSSKRISFGTVETQADENNPQGSDEETPKDDTTDDE